MFIKPALRGNGINGKVIEELKAWTRKKMYLNYPWMYMVTIM